MSKKRKEKKSKQKKGSASKLPQALFELLDSQPGRAYSIKQIVKKLVLKKRDDIKQLTQLIYKLVDQEKVRQVSDGSYASNGNYANNQKIPEVTGVVDNVN